MKRLDIYTVDKVYLHSVYPKGILEARIAIAHYTNLKKLENTIGIYTDENCSKIYLNSQGDIMTEKEYKLFLVKNLLK